MVKPDVVVQTGGWILCFHLVWICGKLWLGWLEVKNNEKCIFQVILVWEFVFQYQELSCLKWCCEMCVWVCVRVCVCVCVCASRGGETEVSGGENL